MSTLGLNVFGTASGLTSYGQGALASPSAEVNDLIDIHKIEGPKDQTTIMIIPGMVGELNTVMVVQYGPSLDRSRRTGFWGVATVHLERNAFADRYREALYSTKTMFDLIECSAFDQENQVLNFEAVAAQLNAHSVCNDVEARFQPTSTARVLQIEVIQGWRNRGSLSDLLSILTRHPAFETCHGRNLLLTDFPTQQSDGVIADDILDSWIEDIFDQQDNEINSLFEQLNRHRDALEQAQEQLAQTNAQISNIQASYGDEIAGLKAQIERFRDSYDELKAEHGEVVFQRDSAFQELNRRRVTNIPPAQYGNDDADPRMIGGRGGQSGRRGGFLGGMTSLAPAVVLGGSLIVAAGIVSSGSEFLSFGGGGAVEETAQPTGEDTAPPNETRAFRNTFGPESTSNGTGTAPGPNVLTGVEPESDPAAEKAAQIADTADTYRQEFEAATSARKVEMVMEVQAYFSQQRFLPGDERPDGFFGPGTQGAGETFRLAVLSVNGNLAQIPDVAGPGADVPRSGIDKSGAAEFVRPYYVAMRLIKDSGLGLMPVSGSAPDQRTRREEMRQTAAVASSPTEPPKDETEPLQTDLQGSATTQGNGELPASGFVDANGNVQPPELGSQETLLSQDEIAAITGGPGANGGSGGAGDAESITGTGAAANAAGVPDVTEDAAAASVEDTAADSADATVTDAGDTESTVPAEDGADAVEDTVLDDAEDKMD